MAERFKLDFIKAEKENLTKPRVRLVARAYPADDKGFISLTPVCTNIGDFERSVEELKTQLDNLVIKARQSFQQDQAEKEVETRKPKTVEEIWQAMEKCETIEEMQEIFNALEVDKRKEVAEFILTQVNIFKGAAATFSQHYNEKERLLE